MMNDEERQNFYRIRREAGEKIDPATAKVRWTHIQMLDPYGVEPNLPEEYQQVGRGYFARAPGSDTWVWFGDLPKATVDALWERLEREPFVRDYSWLFEEQSDT